MRTDSNYSDTEQHIV